KLAVSSSPSRLTVVKPVKEKVTAYVPPGRSRILYWPSESVTTVRVFSMSAGLDASTVTPGSTAPDVSRTTPAIALVPCALAIPVTKSRHTQAAAQALIVAPFVSGHVAVFLPRRRGEVNENP